MTPVREGPAQPAPAPRDALTIPADHVRGGDILLNTPLRRAVFIAGLLGLVGLAVLSWFAP